MHTAHGERRKVFPVFLTSEHVTDQRVKNTPPPPLQPIDSSTVHEKKTFGQLVSLCCSPLYWVLWTECEQMCFNV